MPAPIVAAALPVVKELGSVALKAVNAPVIGWQRTTVKTRKTRTDTTVTSFQLRAWEAGVGVLILGGLFASMIAAGSLQWKEHTYDYTDGKGKKQTLKINLPAAGRSGTISTSSGFSAIVGGPLTDSFWKLVLG